MCAVLEEQRLDTKAHDCTGFDSGVPQIYEHLSRYASQDRRRNIAKVYVLVNSREPAKILGYCAISAAQLMRIDNRPTISESASSTACPVFAWGALPFPWMSMEGESAKSSWVVL